MPSALPVLSSTGIFSIRHSTRSELQAYATEICTSPQVYVSCRTPNFTSTSPQVKARQLTYNEPRRDVTSFTLINPPAGTGLGRLLVKTKTNPPNDFTFTSSPVGRSLDACFPSQDQLTRRSSTSDEHTFRSVAHGLQQGMLTLMTFGMELGCLPPRPGPTHPQEQC